MRLCGPKASKIVLLVIKIILMVIIAAIIAIASYGTFGSRAFQFRAKDSTTGKRPEYDKFVGTEYASLMFAVVSVLLLLASSILHCVSNEGRYKSFTNADITLCFFSAFSILLTGVLLMIAQAGECDYKSDTDYGKMRIKEFGYEGSQATFSFNEDYFVGGGSSADEYKPLSKFKESIGQSGNFKTHTCDTSMTVRDCAYNICVDVWLIYVKTNIGMVSILLGLMGFWVPCLLAYSVHKQRPQNAMNVMGGGGHQPGGDGGTQEYPLYAPSQTEYQHQYGGAGGGGAYGGGGGAYVYQNQPAPQISPSQNLAIAPDEYPLYTYAPKY